MSDCVISIVMPVYNADKFVEEAITTIVNQSFRNFEFIIVDDGSDDQSINIINKFKSVDGRIKLFHQNHQGAANARNFGIDKSKGEYLYFVDADDRFSSSMLAKMYSKSIWTNADIVICGYRKFNNADNSTLWQFTPSSKFTKNERLICNEYLDCLYDIVPPSPWGKLFKSSLIKNNQIRFQSLTSCNDFSFSYTAISHATVMGICRESLLEYRSNTGLNISKDRGSKAINILSAIENLECNVKKAGRYDQLKNTMHQRGLSSFKNELKQCNDIQKEKLIQHAKVSNSEIVRMIAKEL